MRKSERILWMFSVDQACHNGGLRKEDTLVRQDSAWRTTCRGEKAVEAAQASMDEVLREGARRMLQQAIEAEVGDYLARHDDARESEADTGSWCATGVCRNRILGRRLDPHQQPRVRDRRGDGIHERDPPPPAARRASERSSRRST
jgi:hypothetical protein